MYKVFFNAVPLIITSNRGEAANYSHSCSVEPHECNPQNALRIIGRNPDVEALICCGSDQKQIYEEFKKHFKYIEAAGGVVFNGQNQILTIKRLGMWDLPKGKRERNESIEDCAVREVAEECGIPAPDITAPLPNTYHVYKLKGNFVLKCTYWFKMQSSATHKLTPQTEEDISEVRWLSGTEMAEFKRNTYASILDLLNTIDI